MTDSVQVCRIMGVDPGKATGVAVVDLMRREHGPAHPLLRRFYIKPLVCLTVPWEDHPKNLRVQVQAATAGLDVPFIVSNEKYVVTRLTQQSQDTQSLEVSGVLLAILDILEVPHTAASYLPSSSKTLCSDDNLRNWLGLDLKRLDDHSRDALRQACTWAVAYIHSKVQIIHK